MFVNISMILKQDILLVYDADLGLNLERTAKNSYTNMYRQRFELKTLEMTGNVLCTCIIGWRLNIQDIPVHTYLSVKETNKNKQTSQNIRNTSTTDLLVTIYGDLEAANSLFIRCLHNLY